MTEWNYKIRSLSDDDEGDATQSFAAGGGPWLIRTPSYSSPPPSKPNVDVPARGNELAPTDEPAYQLIRAIGVGGMGEVWQALQVSLGRMVAIKRVQGNPESRGAKWDRLNRDFVCEAIVASRLEHPNIVPVHDLYKDENDSPLLAMKLVEGREWSDILADDLPQLPVADFLGKHIPILIGMVQAVAFAHSRGVIHRDLKPAQVMVGEYGEILLTDWGLAVLTTEADRRFQDTITLPTVETASSPSGTPALMAPEQTREKASDIGPWTDIYLIGGTLYFLLTGTYPHQAQTVRASIQRASTGLVVSPSDREPDREIPAELENLSLRCLAADPKQRPATVAIVLDELRNFVTGSGRRRESASLTHQVENNFPHPHETSYEALEATWATLARAGELWPANSQLPGLRERTLTLYSQTALDARDLRLARLHAGRMGTGDSKQELIDAIDAEESRIAAEHLTRKVAKAGLLAAMLVIAIGGALFTKSISDAGKQAVVERDLARQARLEAARARKGAQSALGEADQLIRYMVGDLGNKLDTIGRLDVLDSAIAKVDELFKERDGRGIVPINSKERVDLLLRLSNIRGNQGKFDESETLVREAAAIAEAAASKEPNILRRSQHALTLVTLGSVLSDLGRPKDAEEVLRQSLQMFEGIHEENPSDEENLNHLGETWNLLGGVFLDLGNLEEGLAALEKCLAISQELSARNPTDMRWKERVAVTWGWVGNALHSQGKVADSRKAYENRLAIYNEMVQAEPLNITYQSRVAQTHHHLGRIVQDLGMLDQAREHMDNALLVRERLANADPTNADYARELALSLSRAGGIAELQGNFEEALPLFQRARKIQEDLATDLDNLGRQAELSQAIAQVAEIQETLGDCAGSAENLLESHRIIERVVTIEPSSTQWQRLLAHSWRKISNNKLEQQDLDGAMEAATKGLEIAERLASADPTNSPFQAELADSLRLSGRLHLSRGDLPKARNSLQKAMGINTSEATGEATSRERQVLARSQNQMAALLEKENRLDDAVSTLKLALGTLKELSTLDATNTGLQHDCAACELQLGVLLCKQEQFDKSRECLESAKQAMESLVGATKGGRSFQLSLAEVHQELGTLAATQDDKANAIAEWRTALRIFEDAFVLDPCGKQAAVKIDGLREKIKALESGPSS